MIYSDFDITILGAGPVGKTLAVLLSRISSNPQRIAILEGSSVELEQKNITIPDIRVIALNYGSLTLLKSLQIYIKPSSDIKSIHISQYGQSGSCIIRDSDFKIPNLGSSITYSDLCTLLKIPVMKSGVTIFHDSLAEINSQDNEWIYIQYGNKYLRSKIAIQSNGISSKDFYRDYKQYALVTNVKASYPCPNSAWECFTSEGSIALLPHPHANNIYSLIWCNSIINIKKLNNLNNHVFCNILNEKFGNLMGKLDVQSPRYLFPLELIVRNNLVNGRLVSIGNAAQILHPIAGQGLNLALRDTIALSTALKPWILNPKQNPSIFLENFSKSRNVDRYVTIVLTDFLSTISSIKFPLIKHVFSFLLFSINSIKPLRKRLASFFLKGIPN